MRVLPQIRLTYHLAFVLRSARRDARFGAGDVAVARASCNNAHAQMDYACLNRLILSHRTYLTNTHLQLTIQAKLGLRELVQGLTPGVMLADMSSDLGRNESKLSTEYGSRTPFCKIQVVQLALKSLPVLVAGSPRPFSPKGQDVHTWLRVRDGEVSDRHPDVGLSTVERHAASSRTMRSL
jgi:hypothetical protein